jgi:hypothetical protein
VYLLVVSRIFLLGTLIFKGPTAGRLYKSFGLKGLIMVSTKVVEKIKMYVLCSATFFFENHAVYEIMWKDTVEPGRPQIIIRRMRIAFKMT